MASDVIRCPGCGVNMDLSAFRTRPEQVVCPRCHTRSIVPPVIYDTQADEGMNDASSYPTSQIDNHQLQGTFARPYAPQNVQGASQSFMAPQTAYAYPLPQFQPAPQVEGAAQSYRYQQGPAQQYMPLQQVPYSQQVPLPYPIPLQQGLPLQQTPLQQPVPSFQQIPLQQMPGQQTRMIDQSLQHRPAQADPIQGVSETQEYEKNGQVQHPVPIMPEQYPSEDGSRVQQLPPYFQYEALCPPVYPLYQQEQIGYGPREQPYGLSSAYYPLGQPYYIQQQVVPQQYVGGYGQEGQEYGQAKPTYQPGQHYDQEPYQQDYAALGQDQMLYQDDQLNQESQMPPYASDDAEQVISADDHQQVLLHDQRQISLEEYEGGEALEAPVESEELASELVFENELSSENSTVFEIDDDADADLMEQVDESFDDVNARADDTTQDDPVVDEAEQHDELLDTPAVIEPIMPLTDDVVYVDEQIDSVQSCALSEDSDSRNLAQEQEEDSIIFDLEKSEIVEPISESIHEGSDVHDGLLVDKTMELEQKGTVASEVDGPTSDEGMFLLPIDKKGNAEPLAFAVIGLLSIVFLIPLIGIILCIIALAMRAQEKRRNLYNAYRGATLFFAIVGLILNIALLGIMATAVVYTIMSPSALVMLL